VSNNTRRGNVFLDEKFKGSILDVILPVILAIMACIGVWVSTIVFKTNYFLISAFTHLILVVLAIIGVVARRLSLIEAGVIPPSLRYSLYWSLYLSISVCIPAFTLITILHVLGVISVEFENLNIYRIIRILASSMVFGGLAEEFFFRGYMQGSFNRVIGQEYSPVLSGVVFGIVHLANYVNPLTGVYDLGIGAVVWVLLSCFVGVYFGFLRRMSGDIYCPALFHGSQDFAMSVMDVINCPPRVKILAMGIGWLIFLFITYRRFKSSTRY